MAELLGTEMEETASAKSEQIATAQQPEQPSPSQKIETESLTKRGPENNSQTETAMTREQCIRLAKVLDYLNGRVAKLIENLQATQQSQGEVWSGINPALLKRTLIEADMNKAIELTGNHELINFSKEIESYPQRITIDQLRNFQGVIHATIYKLSKTS